MIPVALVLTLVLVPTAFATDLSGLLERGGQASYGAEQVVSCVTPDGVTNAILTIEQSGGHLVVGSDLVGSKAVAMAPGNLAVVGTDGSVEQVSVLGQDGPVPLAYVVTELGSTRFLGRDATTYRLERDGVVRAELVLDDLTGVVVRSSTFSADGALYCMQRFVSFEPGERTIEQPPTAGASALVPLEQASGLFPDQIVGFVRLDEYEDDSGLRFTYYSDGFFSFGVFRTPSLISLPDAVRIKGARGDYYRVFTAGQVFYTWEIEDGGMALIGDLPPDLHDIVLGTLPEPERPGLFRRIWRSLFGAASVGGVK